MVSSFLKMSDIYFQGKQTKASNCQAYVQYIQIHIFLIIIFDFVN